MIRRHAMVFGLLFAIFSTVSVALAGERIWLVGEPSEGMPSCEEFFDKWEAPGAPPGLLAMAGYSREVFAAKACLDKNDVPMACKHWQGLLVLVDKLGPPMNENRGDIERLMQEHDCEAAPASEAKSPSDPGSAPASAATPNSQSGPVSGAGVTPEAVPSSESVPASEAKPDAAE